MGLISRSRPESFPAHILVLAVGLFIAAQVAHADDIFDHLDPTPRTTSLPTGTASSRPDPVATAEPSITDSPNARRAYEQGVRDAMRELQGHLHAQQQFVYERPIVDMVTIPAGVSNGAFYPPHEVPVIVTPGRWIETNGVSMPRMNGGAP